MLDAALDKFLISLPIGLGFLIIFIIPFKFLSTWWSIRLKLNNSLLLNTYENGS